MIALDARAQFVSQTNREKFMKIQIKVNDGKLTFYTAKFVRILR